MSQYWRKQTISPDDVLVIMPEDLPDAEVTKDTLDLVRQSLQGVVELPTDIGLDEPERLNLSLFFSGNFGTLRPFIPTFDSTECVTIGVPTIFFAGEITRSDQESLFQHDAGEIDSRLPLSRLPDPTFGGIAPDLTQQDIKDLLKIDVHYADCYNFSGSAGEQIVIGVEGDNSLALVGPDGVLVAANDNCLGSGTCIPADAFFGGGVSSLCQAPAPTLLK